MKVMMLAAGEGTRLRPHTLKLPKPAIPFLGVPLACHSLALFEDLKSLDVVVNTFHLPQEISRLYNKHKSLLGSLSFSHETDKILGSGGAIVKAREQLSSVSDFFLINADEVILPKNTNLLSHALKKHQESNALSTLLVIEHPEVGTKFGGVWCENERVLGFGKQPPQHDLKPWHFIGVQILNQRIFNYLPSFGESNILYDGVAAGIRQGELAQIIPIECQWFETGNPQDFLNATKVCLETIKTGSTGAEQLRKTLNMFAGEGYEISSDKDSANLVFSSSLEQAQNLKICESSVIGKNVKIEPGVSVRGSVVADNQTLLAGESLVDTLLL